MTDSRVRHVSTGAPLSASWTPGHVLGDDEPLLKIGEVADRVGLSLRTIRFYEEEGLVVPETRTSGGFRLYSAVALNRLELIKRMKPLGFTVEEMVEVFAALDALHDETTDPDQRAALSQQLDAHRDRVEAKAADLEAKAARGRQFGHFLLEVAEHNRGTGIPRPRS